MIKPILRASHATELSATSPQNAEKLRRKNRLCPAFCPSFPARGLAFVFLAAACGPALVSPPCRGDVIELNDGAQLKGKVVDLGGNSISIGLGSGRRIVPKRDIKKVTFTMDPAEKPKLDSDVVLCRGGNDLRGQASVSEDGRTVVVKLPDGSQASVSRADVLRIIYQGEDPEGTQQPVVYTRELDEQIDLALKELSGRDAGTALAAEERLKGYGLYALPKVEEAWSRVKQAGGEAAKRLNRIRSLEELKKLVSDALEAVEPRIYSLLTAREPKQMEEKRALLEEMFTRAVDDSVPIAKFLLLDPEEDSGMRAFLVGILGALGRNQDLLDLYQRSAGQLQLAVAIALGKNRILLGLPTLIETLDMEERELRRLAAKNLKEFTGLDHGYHADDTPLARRQAIDRWKAWWRKNQETYLLQAEVVLAGKESETPERRLAVEQWKKAGAAAQGKRYEEAEALLRRALNLDPTFFNAHVQLAILLYTHRGRIEEARNILDDLLVRKIPGISPENFRWVYYHLGKIYQVKNDLDSAMDTFNQCVMADPQFFHAHLALGDLSFFQATHGQDLKAEKRKELLQGAVKSYQAAVEAIDNRLTQLVILYSDDLPLDEVPPIDVREYNRTVLQVNANFRNVKARSQLGMARCQSILGDKDEAVYTLISATNTLSYDKSQEASSLQSEIRDYLGLLYEERGDFQSAVREYRKVVKELDASDLKALEGLKRLGARAAPEEPQKPRARKK